MDKMVIVKLIIISYLLFSWWTTRLILKSKYLDKRKKTKNIYLTWLIPFLWGFVIRGIIKPKDNDIMTKKKRKSSSNNNTDNWQSLTGFGG